MRWTSFLAVNYEISPPSARCPSILKDLTFALIATQCGDCCNQAVLLLIGAEQGDSGEVIGVGAEQRRFDQRTLLDRCDRGETEEPDVRIEALQCRSRIPADILDCHGKGDGPHCASDMTVLLHSPLARAALTRCVHDEAIFQEDAHPTWAIGVSIAPQIWQSNAQARRQCLSAKLRSEHSDKTGMEFAPSAQLRLSFNAGKVRDCTIAGLTRAATAIFSAAVLRARSPGWNANRRFRHGQEVPETRNSWWPPAV